jgi:hypothetical protein
MGSDRGPPGLAFPPGRSLRRHAAPPGEPPPGYGGASPGPIRREAPPVETPPGRVRPITDALR